MFDSGVRNVGGGGTSPYNKEALQFALDVHLPVVWEDDFDHAGTPDSWGRWPGSDDWKDMHSYGSFENQHWAWFKIPLQVTVGGPGVDGAVRAIIT